MGKTGARFERVDGVLLVDKPAGISSNAALQRVRRAYAAQRAGHSGTLDPMATGLLVVCFGEATKFAQIPTDADKAYEATIVLGIATDTGDAEGRVTASLPVATDAAAIRRAAAALTGAVSQMPPAYSALKRDGKAYYEYARAGIEIERRPRTVLVHRFDVLDVDLPRVRVAVTCSKGTYVRVLAEQLGELLGCGGHLGALRRNRVGSFDVARARSVEAIEAASRDERTQWLLPVDAVTAGLPSLRVDAAAEARLVHGQPVSSGWAESTAFLPEEGVGVRRIRGGIEDARDPTPRGQDRPPPGGVDETPRPPRQTPTPSRGGAAGATGPLPGAIPGTMPGGSADPAGLSGTARDVSPQRFAVFGAGGRFLGVFELDGGLLRPRRLVSGAAQFVNR